MRTKVERRLGLWVIGAIAGAIVLVVVFALLYGPAESGVGSDAGRAVEDSNLPRLFSSAASSNWPGQSLPEIELLVALPEMPEKIMVYKQVFPEPLTEADAWRMAQEYFGVPGNATVIHREGSNYIRLKAETHLFELDKRRGWFNCAMYSHSYTSKKKRREDYPSDAECKQIAIDFLNKRGLKSDDARLTRVIDNTGAGFITVRFTQVIGGYGCRGPAGSMLLDINPDGKIVTMGKQWITVEPLNEYPTKTAEKALDEIKRGEGLFSNVTRGATIRIRDLHVLYNVNTDGYVEPLYSLDYSTSDGLRYVVVPAILQDFLLTPEEMQEQMRREWEQYHELRGREE